MPRAFGSWGPCGFRLARTSFVHPRQAVQRIRMRHDDTGVLMVCTAMQTNCLAQTSALSTLLLLHAYAFPVSFTIRALLRRYDSLPAAQTCSWATRIRPV